MTPLQTILFVCEHGAAKSVVAATHFNKLARERDLNIHAIARGTTPDAELSPQAVEGLNRDGLTPTESVPQRIAIADVESAIKIVSFCELPKEFQGKTNNERWDDVPPVSEDYDKSRDAIVEKIKQLINTIS
ncbi:MAG: hypothetical protein IT314_04155 [Anaerolineales bacterium]|nr:hypothetical protein [Anaerolineales bacterium]